MGFLSGFVFSILILAVFAHSAFAIPVPVFDLSELATSSDLIIAASIEDVQETGRTVMNLRGMDLEAQILMSHLNVDRVLKGSTSKNLISVRFVLPIREYIGYRSLDRGSYRLVFLRKSRDAEEYEFTSPYYPSLPAARGPVKAQEKLIDTLVGELANVVRSPESDWNSRRVAMFALRGVSSERATEALREALASTDSRINIFAAGLLLLRNDISGLAVAEVTLSARNQHQIRDDDRNNLLAGITYGIHDQRALNVLKHLLQAPDPDVRSAAASGLGNTGASDARELLIESLHDPNTSVRYASATALANLTGAGEWRPANLEEFAKDEPRYLAHWTNR
jgi:hypothetical protein